MINITLPDGSVRTFDSGITPFDIAKSISHGLAKKVLVAEINNELHELSTPINADSTLKLLTWDDKIGKSAFWHSSAHILAEAIQYLYPQSKFTIGPSVENGFYYDIDFGEKSFTSDDIPKVENKMIELTKQNNPFKLYSISKADALDYYKKKNNEYKVELIENLKDGDITFCDQGTFTDLCRGGHIPDTGYVKAIKLLSVAGAYWRGDEKNKQLTRIYGISFPKKKTSINTYYC